MGEFSMRSFPATSDFFKARISDHFYQVSYFLGHYEPFLSDAV